MEHLARVAPEALEVPGAPAATAAFPAEPEPAPALTLASTELRVAVLRAALVVPAVLAVRAVVAQRARLGGPAVPVRVVPARVVARVVVAEAAEVAARPRRRPL